MSYALVALSCLLLVVSAQQVFADDGEDETEILGGVGDGCTTDGFEEEGEDPTEAAPETAGSRAGKVVRAGSQHKAHARTAAHGKAAKARTAAKKAGRTAGKARKA